MGGDTGRKFASLEEFYRHPPDQDQEIVAYDAKRIPYTRLMLRV